MPRSPSWGLDPDLTPTSTTNSNASRIAMKTWLNSFNRYKASLPTPLATPIEDLPIPELNHHLCTFFNDLKRVDGTSYKSGSLKACLSNLNCHLKANRKDGLNVITDPRFANVRDVIERKRRESRIEWKTRGPERKSRGAGVEDSEEEDEGQEGEDTTPGHGKGRKRVLSQEEAQVGIPQIKQRRKRTSTNGSKLALSPEFSVQSVDEGAASTQSNVSTPQPNQSTTISAGTKPAASLSTLLTRSTAPATNIHASAHTSRPGRDITVNSGLNQVFVDAFLAAYSNLVPSGVKDTIAAPTTLSRSAVNGTINGKLVNVNRGGVNGAGAASSMGVTGLRTAEKPGNTESGLVNNDQAVRTTVQASSTPTPILFLRQRNDDSTPTSNTTPSDDEYAAAFAPPTYSPHFIPVLSHNDTVNLPALCTLLWNRSNDFCGLIATSARAIHPLTKAFPIPPSATDVVRRGAEHLKAKWRAKPFYCVGKATAAAAAAAGFQPAGWDTGTAATLAGLIVDAGCHKPTPYWLAHWEKANGNMHLPETYLFLGGDKASDVLPKRLEEGGVKYEQLTVYETTPSPTFHADLASLPASPTPQHKRPWVVFFSPSGVDIALRAIRTHPGWKHARLASIGPTTSERIAELGEVVDVEAPTPGVEGVWEGIRRVEEEGVPAPGLGAQEVVVHGEGHLDALFGGDTPHPPSQLTTVFPVPPPPPPPPALQHTLASPPASDSTTTAVKKLNLEMTPQAFADAGGFECFAAFLREVEGAPGGVEVSLKVRE